MARLGPTYGIYNKAFQAIDRQLVTHFLLLDLGNMGGL
jgi:hypothetical protein